MTTNSSNRHWQDAANLVLGVWVIVSPWVVGYTHADLAPGNAVIMGVAVAIVSVSGLISPDVWEEWINLLLGTILLVSPAALAFYDFPAAVWTAVATGAAIGALSVWSLKEQIGFPARRRPRARQTRGTVTGQQSHAGR